MQGELREAICSVVIAELERARHRPVASHWGRECSGARRFFASEVAQPSGLRSGSSRRVCDDVGLRGCVAPGARQDTRVIGHHHRSLLWLLNTWGV